MSLAESTSYPMNKSTHPTTSVATAVCALPTKPPIAEIVPPMGFPSTSSLWSMHSSHMVCVGTKHSPLPKDSAAIKSANRMKLTVRMPAI